MIPDHFSSYCILHGHALKFKEEMPTSLTDILDEIVSIINFIKSISRKTFVQLFELQAELAIFFFFMEQHFSNYVYSYMGIWHSFKNE